MKRTTQTEKKNTIGIVLQIIGGLLVFIALIFWFYDPAFFDIRYSLPYRIAVYMVLSAGLFLFAFHPRVEQPLYGKILLVSGAVVLWVSLLLSGRANAFLFLAYGCVSAAADVVFFLRGQWKMKRDDRYTGKDMPHFSQVVVSLCAFIFVLRQELLIEYAQSEFPFWLPSLIAAGCLCVLSVVCVFLFKKYILRKKYQILIPIFVLVGAFLFVWLLLCTVNFSLDVGDPQKLTAEIVDRRVDSGRRRPATYKLKLCTQEGEEFTLNVAQRVWSELDEGDQITVSLYKGALDESYYIYEE